MLIILRIVNLHQKICPKMDWKHFYHDTALENFASCLVLKKIEAMF